MFDVGFWELALISVVALVIVGPERLPGMAYKAGLWVGKVRSMLRDVKADINRELREQNVAELDELKRDIEDAGGQFKDATGSFSESVSTKKKTSATAKKRTTPASKKTGKTKTAKAKSAKTKTTKAKTAKAKSAKAKSKSKSKSTSKQNSANGDYYVYENRTSRQTTLHTDSCGYCNHGKGRGGPNLQNIQWHGPFTGLAAARKQQHMMGGATKECRCV